LADEETRALCPQPQTVFTEYALGACFLDAKA